LTILHPLRRILIIQEPVSLFPILDLINPRVVLAEDINLSGIIELTITTDLALIILITYGILRIALLKLSIDDMSGLIPIGLEMIRGGQELVC
jgi:hypothetical protein